MPHVSGIGTIFAPGQAQNVNAASDAIDATLDPGSNYFQSGNIGLGTAGTQGNAFLNQAASLGQMQVGINSAPMDADTAKLGGLSDLQYGLSLNGGMAEAAARQKALADIANLGQGGGAAGRAITAGSEDATNQAVDVAMKERSANAQGAVSTGAAAAATALQKAVYAAHVSHANHMTAIAAKGYQQQLAQMQAQYDQMLNAGAAGARNGQATAYQQANDATRKAALSAATTIASAGGTAYGTLSNMGTTTPQSYTKGGGINLGVPNGSGGFTGQSASVTMQPSLVSRAAVNPFDTEAEGDTTTVTDPKQWSTWLAGSTLAI